MSLKLKGHIYKAIVRSVLRSECWATKPVNKKKIHYAEMQY